MTVQVEEIFDLHRFILERRILTICPLQAVILNGEEIDLYDFKNREALTMQQGRLISRISHKNLLTFSTIRGIMI